MALRWVAGQVSPREVSRRDRLLEELTRSTSLVSDLEVLNREMCAGVREIAGCQAVVLCEYIPSREAFVPAPAHDLDKDTAHAVTIRAAGRLAKWLRVNEEPLALPDDRGVFDYLEP